MLSIIKNCALIARIVLFWNLLVFHNPLFTSPSNLQFNHLTTKDGLSQSWVRAIIQDSYGFMWFGTNDGLNRYDGYTFTVYKHNPNNEHSLSNSAITSLFEDKQGNLWIGTINGLNLYDREKDRFICREDCGQNSIEQILELTDGRLLIATLSSQQYQYIPEKDTIVTYFDYYDENNVLNTNYSNDVLQDVQGNIWFATFDGLHLFDEKALRSTYFLNDHKTVGWNNINAFCKGKDGRIWLGTQYNGLVLLTYKNGLPEFTHYLNDLNDEKTITAGPILTLLEDSRGYLWIGTEEHGLDILDLNNFDETNPVFEHFPHDPNVPFSVSNNSIYSLYEDRQGTVWVGNYRGGIDYFNPLTRKFSHFKHDPKKTNSLSNNSVKVFFEEGDSLWIGTEGGLNLFDKKKSIFKRFVHNPYDPYSLGANNVWSIYEDSRNNLWIGTYGGGLNLMNRRNGTFRRFMHTENEQSIGDNKVSAILEDQDGNLWIGTVGGGLNLFDYRTKTFKKYKNVAGDSTGLLDNWVRGVFETRYGELWVSTDEGVSLFNLERNAFIHYTQETNNKKINFRRSRVFYEDSQCNLWIGSQGSLNYYDREKNWFYCYLEEHGLPNSQIRGILEDDHGNLWISTNKGISKLIDGVKRPKDPVFKNYDMGDGLQEDEFIERACLKGYDGYLYFGGINGFNVFHPDSLHENPYKPGVVITRLLIANKPVEIVAEGSPLNSHISVTKELALSHKHSVITFEYAALNYIIPAKNQYAFMLEGFENDWNFVGTKRSATYTNLDPGDYVFRVKAANNDGLWNEDGVALRLKIIPPWWQTSWAFIGYVLLAVLLLSTIWRIQLNKERMKTQLQMEHENAEKLEQINRMKTRFFSNITHEFRTPLTLIIGVINKLIPQEKSMLKAQDYNTILRNSRKLYQLINQLLDLSKLEAGAMPLKARPENIIPFLEEMMTLFQPLADRKNIRMQFCVDSDSSPGNSTVEVYFDRDKLEKIVSNLLSNAIKFTPQSGKIDVSLKKEDHHVAIIFKDSGIGIAPNEIDNIFNRFHQVDGSHTRKYEGTGIGLALTKELLEIHHGTIEVTSRVNQGTQFTVRLPLGRNYLKPEEIVEDDKNELYQPNIDQPILHFPEEDASAEMAVENGKAHHKNLPLLLVVEDNADLRKYLESSLANNYQIITANDGEQGVEKALIKIPDLIISDVMMSGIDGFELCKRIKSDERTSHIPVILLTARASGESKIEGLETGADDYVTKPFEIKELRVRVRNLIEQRNKLRMRYNRLVGLKPAEITTDSMDEEFMKKALTILEEKYGESEFNVGEFAREIGISRTHLNRKFKALTGQTIREFIRVFRLNRAAQMLEKNSGTVLEIGYAVGFESISYFCTSFKDKFGVSPSNFRKKSSGNEIQGTYPN